MNDSNHSFRQIERSVENVFETVLQRVNPAIKVQHKKLDTGVKILDKFESLKVYEKLYVHKVTEFITPGKTFLILLIEKHSKIIRQGRSIHHRRVVEIEEVEPVLVFKLPKDIGKVYMKPETLGDKIADLVNRMDIDFKEFPRFSSNYYLVGEKPALIHQEFPRSILSTLDNIKGLTIEVTGKLGLLRNEKNLSEKNLAELINIGYAL
ncbi:MAG: hypothetical protein ACK4ND_00130 [Cytophagaceae bacterium]